MTIHDPDGPLDPPAPASEPPALHDIPHWAAPAVPPPPIGAPPPPATPLADRRRGLAVPAATVALSLVAGWLGGRLTARDEADPASAVRAASVAFEGETLDVASVLGAVEPSVVSIETSVSMRRGPFVQQAQGAGTGVVIDGAGHVITNAHVVEGATTITVTVDGTERRATLVGADEAADIAVVRVDDATGLVPAALATDGTPAVGDEVVAIGNALALEGGLTVTQGIVSALDRAIETSSGTLDGLIQTDAAISSGNSGGALVDARGRVVGINTAVASSSGTVEASNVGFAISIADAMRVADELLGVA